MNFRWKSSEVVIFCHGSDFPYRHFLCIQNYQQLTCLKIPSQIHNWEFSAQELKFTRWPPTLTGWRIAVNRVILEVSLTSDGFPKRASTNLSKNRQDLLLTLLSYLKIGPSRHFFSFKLILHNYGKWADVCISNCSNLIWITTIFPCSGLLK